MHRAYSVLTIKEVSAEPADFVFRGVASTPTPDRMGDIVEPLGAKFALPMPLLWQHQADQPVGRVEFARPTKEGIPFKAVIPRVTEPGRVKERIDEAIHSLQYKLVGAVSIGFRAIEGAVERLKDGGLRFKEWEWLELSLVTIPANAEATISTIKGLDSLALAASGLDVPGVERPDQSAGVSARRLNTTAGRPKQMNIQEEIRSLESQHATATARQTGIFEKARAEGRTLDGDEKDQFDSLGADVASYADDLKRLRSLELQVIPRARAVSGESSEAAMAVRQGVQISAGRPVVPKGIPFVRYAMALANGRGSIADAMMFAKRWKDSTPEVLQALQHKADAGTTTDATWAAPLASPQTLASEFIDLLRPSTFLGKLTGLTRVPFNVKIVRQTAGSTIAWVGQTAVKPVGELAFDEVTMGITKVAGIVVISEELARLSTPSAEEKVRSDLIKQTAQFLDEQFIDPAVTATANNPASITNGAFTIAASGDDAAAFRCDLRSLVQEFTLQNQSLAGMAILMNETLAGGLGFIVNALGQPEFPGVTVNGGQINGVTVITSGNLPGDTSGSIVVMVKQAEILLADEGGVNVDVSREASLDMAGSTSAVFNLWQRNCVGLRAERFINWQKAHPSAVAYISGANYGSCGS
jgi:HK97 family phage major capsid protein/HK97 family phage prohead protease